MERDKIVKAYEHCTTKIICKGCPYASSREDDCTIHKDVLTLLKELTKELDYWKQQTFNGCVDKQRMDKKIKELTEENEKLNEEIRVRDEIIDYRGSEVLRHDKCIRTLHKEIELIKEEVVQKFADYLKEHSFNCDPSNGFSFDAIDVDELDDYVKEFLEKNK